MLAPDILSLARESCFARRILPRHRQQALAVVNHRIARQRREYSSVNVTITRDAHLLADLAAHSSGTLEPAPVTPSDAPAAASRYKWHGNLIGGGLGGTHTVDESASFFLALHFPPHSRVKTDNGDDADIRADSFVEMIMLFTTLILNADEAAL
ncbi:hypothetical protein DFH09DRAFT_1303245 [Mycena vulgaris]|nr:hypothetical protein DFH09DRAFT_1303245 [Mycena vulgaris]